MAKHTLKSHNKYVFVFILVIILGGFFLQATHRVKDRYVLFSSTPKGKYQVRRVYGGALLGIFYEGNFTYVRMTGIRAPEEVAGITRQSCGASSAKTRLQTIMPEFSKITIQKDSATVETSKDNTIYRYVTNEKNEDVGAIIVESGFGFVDENASFDKKESYRKLQQRAQQQKLGLWSECSVSQNGSQYVIN